MSGPDPVQAPVVVGEGVFERRRAALAELSATLVDRSARVVDADLSDRFISIPLALLGWVGTDRREQWRWVCQVPDPDTCRSCDQIGRADTEAEAIDALTIHICHDHGGLPE